MQRKLQQALDEVNQNLIQDLTDKQASHVAGGGIVEFIILYNSTGSSTGDRTRTGFATGGWGG